MTPLYSIGHGTRKAEALLALLQQHEIAYLADVRSMPFSRFNPQYNRDRLKAFLESHGITYIAMGDTLGGRPQDASCYTEKGKVDYEKVKQKDFFKQGIARLKTASEKGIKLAIMCSESNPAMCHRSRLIGTTLHKEHIPLLHIDEKGQLRPQETLLLEMQHREHDDLFTSLLES